MQPNLIVILGPTASGKTKLAAGVAAALQTEVISADSRQVYKQMDIGTGKDLDEFTVNGCKIPYHLIDILPAGERYHIHQFKNDFFDAFRQISLKGKTPILCGGSGLYIDSILNNFEYTGVPVDENLRSRLIHLSKTELTKILNELPFHPYKNTIDTSTTKRLIRGIEIISYLNTNSFTTEQTPEIHPVIFGTSVTVETRRALIEKRLKHRLQNGLIEEVQHLLSTIGKDQLVYYGLEYKLVTLYLTGELGYDEMNQQLLVAIQQYAKRQMTYFRKMERDGKQIHWIDTTQPIDQKLIQIRNILLEKGFSHP